MLFLIYHADAVDGLVDPQRPLSAAGREHAESLATRARDLGVKPVVIWHSGKLRARQTAEPFWRLCNPLAEFVAARGLQPDDPPAWIKDVVDHDNREIMLVGHMPHMARLFNALIGSSPDVALAFPAHGLVALEQVSDVWIERWRL
jgi:phosphohistidine phosphatase